MIAEIDLLVRTYKQYFSNEEEIMGHLKVPFRSDRCSDGEHDACNVILQPHPKLQKKWLPSLQEIDESVRSLGAFLCGGHCFGFSTQGPSTFDAQGVRNHLGKRRKRVTYNERVEIREFVPTSDHLLNIDRKRNSYSTQCDWYFEPSFYRHINESRHRTTGYRPPPFVTMTERRRRPMRTKLSSGVFESIFDEYRQLI